MKTSITLVDNKAIVTLEPQTSAEEILGAYLAKLHGVRVVRGAYKNGKQEKDSYAITLDDEPREADGS